MFVGSLLMCCILAKIIAGLMRWNSRRNNMKGDGGGQKGGG